MPTIFIIGFPNSGRTSIMKALSMNEVGIMDRILNIGYMDLVYDGKMALKVLDHMGTFYSDGKINDGMLRDVKTIDPACIIGVIDVSWFSAPIENQIQFMMKVRDIFANKKLFLIASKVDKTSRDKLKMIEKTFGKNIYKLSLEKPRNVEKLRKDILDCFSKNRAGLHSK
jgi:GTP1/Obg family GTP-binding protein